jgi:CBS domain-containing protein
MKPPAESSPGSSSEPEVVRLRARRLRLVDDRGDAVGSCSTVFCPEQRRSVDVAACGRCSRLSRVMPEAVECLPSIRSAPSDYRVVARIGGDVCIAEAMSHDAVCIGADALAKRVACALERAGAPVALVVDGAGRLLGLVEAADAAESHRPVTARHLARRINSVSESAPLAHAVDRMVHERARALPVVDDVGNVVGILTDLDALRWVAGRNGQR